MDEIKEIILGALKDAAFMGYDKDDDESQEMFEDLAEETAKKVMETLKK